MLPTRGYATHKPTSQLEPFSFERRDPKPSDIQIEILYCGVCHSDIHQARDEWGGSLYPMVPGHEIIGRIVSVGSAVTKFKPGDTAGVGVFVGACGSCVNCKAGEEQYCTVHLVPTYNGTELDGKTLTFGGYSSQIVVDQKYALRIPASLPLPNAAPLLCAGITTYSPLRRFGAGPGKRVGVVGLGGLGHIAVKLAAAMGAEVTVFSTSKAKQKDAASLGASHFVVTSDPDNLKPLASQFDLIVDTVSAPHDVNCFLNLLGKESALALVGLPETALAVDAFSLITNGRVFAGSMVGSMRKTQEMLDFCGQHNVSADIELIPIQKINEAYDRTVRGDVRYRFVIDMQSL
ncbi:MAG: NAD(P)-dependent alcohol dehydrogenase [Candidatus Korobacteraceae bacterium]